MALVARTYRGSVPDLEHHGRIRRLSRLGRKAFFCQLMVRSRVPLTFARSGAKPMQAIALCESGALEEYGITSQELAVICSSHNGQPEHVALVDGILRKAGRSAQDLLCGAQYPIHEETKRDMIRRGLAPRLSTL